MTAAVIDFATRRSVTVRPAIVEPITVPAPAWWTCPTWCNSGDDCYGGDTLRFANGGEIVTSRHHGGVIWSDVVCDIDGSPIDVRVEVAAIEDPDHGYLDPPVVDITVSAFTTDPDAAEKLGDALRAAAAVARQPLPTSPRSSSAPVGGGRAEMSGRGASPRSCSARAPLSQNGARA
ncbi:hypothetical protein ACFFX1_55190 [Dactylosporangium sucinum]|uniref:Uncharacterized protein n=1 Tax=Dactylosporangium sucinum TaxID=1424081 RepID=A0A917U2Z7_9ACTN|nr:hypothetical protein [Dactylosporangium sucinum]GGM52971.1 hypothetical protein GCM10007977_063220 [Dactylosporangium sucinum]